VRLIAKQAALVTGCRGKGVAIGIAHRLRLAQRQVCGVVRISEIVSVHELVRRLVNQRARHMKFVLLRVCQKNFEVEMNGAFLLRQKVGRFRVVVTKVAFPLFVAQLRPAGRILSALDEPSDIICFASASSRGFNFEAGSA